MLGLKRVAVTGGLSSGKSSLCRLFKELGAYVVSADKIVHELLSSDETLIREVELLLGQDVFINKKIDRRLVAQRVFKDRHLLTELEALIHPKVYKAIEEEYKACCGSTNASLFVAEIPLLFETKANTLFDVSIAVTANDDLRLRRFLSETKSDEDVFKLRNSFQLSQEKKAELADYVIENNASLDELKNSAAKLYQQIK